MFAGEQLALYALNLPVGDLPGVNPEPAKNLSHFVSPKRKPAEAGFGCSIVFGQVRVSHLLQEGCRLIGIRLSDQHAPILGHPDDLPHTTR